MFFSLRISRASTSITCPRMMTLSHLTGNRFQINGISLKISSIDHIRITVFAESSMKLSTLAFFLKCFWFLFCFISLRFCFFAILYFAVPLSSLPHLPVSGVVWHVSAHSPPPAGSEVLHFCDICSLFPHELQVDLEIHPTSFTKNFFQIFHQVFRFSLDITESGKVRFICSSDGKAICARLKRLYSSISKFFSSTSILER